MENIELTRKFAHQEGLRVLGDMLDLRRTEREKITLENRLIPIPDDGSLLFGFQLIIAEKPIPSLILYVRVTYHGGTAFSVNYVKLRLPLNTLVFNYESLNVNWQVNLPEYTQVIKNMTLGKEAREVVIDELNDVVKKLSVWSLQINSALQSANRNMDRSELIRALEERAKYLIGLPERLEPPLSQLSTTVHQYVMKVRLIAEKAQEAFDDESESRITRLLCLSIYYETGHLITDRNEFEKMIQFVTDER